MDKWVIIGSGGFVEGSLMPYFKPGMIKGFITKSPIKSVGFAKAYNLKIYRDLKEAIKDGCTTSYICSPNWTHLDWIKESIKEKINTISEKPIITEEKDLDFIEKNSTRFKGAMIKRAHPFLRKILSRNHTIFNSFGSNLNSPDYKDSRRGGFLMIELIHYIDIALKELDYNYSIQVKGNRVSGEILLSNKKRIFEINYDFDSKISKNSLPFHEDTIKTLSISPSKVLITGKEMIELYKCLFKIQKKIMDINEIKKY